MGAEADEKQSRSERKKKDMINESVKSWLEERGFADRLCEQRIPWDGVISAKDGRMPEPRNKAEYGKEK